jgi:predicted nucleic acid-binding protein
VTTDEVLTEFLNYFAGWDWPVRTRASEVAREILAAEDIVVLGQSHDSFVAGLERFQRRLDKAYSLTDCISMVAMEEEGIRDVLTPDDHFRQAGFRIPM